MTGEILKKLNMSPGAPVTLDSLEEAKKLWMEIALYFMPLTAPTNPVKREYLENLRTQLAEANELIMKLGI